jgi:hypothetical protein
MVKHRSAVRRIAVIGTVLNASLGTAFGQQPPVSLPENERQAAVDEFADATKPDDLRLKALQRVEQPGVQYEPQLLDILRDKTRNDDFRWEAACIFPTSNEWIDAVVEILADPDNGGASLDSRLAEALRRRIVHRLPAQQKQLVLRTFRGLLDDPRPAVRLEAFRALVPENDEVAVKVLSDALQSAPDNPPIPLAEALNLLYAAGPSYHLNTLRPFLANPDPQVQFEAVRALAADAESQPRIREIVLDKASDTRVRQVGMEELARYNPVMADVALDLLDDENEQIPLRLNAARIYLAQMKKRPVEPDKQVRFADGFQALLSDYQETSNALEKLVPELQRDFPVIKEHYEELRQQDQ